MFEKNRIQMFIVHVIHKKAVNPGFSEAVIVMLFVMLLKGPLGKVILIPLHRNLC